MTHRTAQTSPVPVRCTVELPTTVGLDLSDKKAHYHVQRGDGRKVETGTCRTVRESLAALFKRLEGARLVLEAGAQSAWIARLATACGMEVLVANPRKLKLISESDRKTDRTDAELLAEIGRTSPALLRPIAHRSASTQADLCVLRVRDELVRTRTSMINCVRGMLKTFGHRAESCSAKCFARKMAKEIPAELERALRPLLEEIRSVTERISQMKAAIEDLCRQRYPQTKVLQQIPGVGPVTSLSFVLTIEDHRRFPREREVGAYLGLVPRKRSSGNSDPQMRITKAGDRDMRRLLVIAANTMLRENMPDSDLRRFGLRIAGSGGGSTGRKRAKVAVARKMAVLMLHLLKTGEVYDPLYSARRRGELVPA